MGIKVEAALRNKTNKEAVGDLILKKMNSPLPHPHHPQVVVVQLLILHLREVEVLGHPLSLTLQGLKALIEVNKDPRTLRSSSLMMKTLTSMLMERSRRQLSLRLSHSNSTSSKTSW
jgi:hypothetical protein